MTHASHPEILKRLKRAEGHLKSVVAMVEDGRPCLDIAQQLRAVEAAIGRAKQELIHDHIEHCLSPGDSAELKSTLEDLKQLAKYL
ncbi:MAG: metal-sensing transcriptional repressor [Ancalomicrobiaceae bacterium]|nr:metal-sensing transcriptional repressor [Ancalomicrobiaceae bacterium]